MYLKFLSSLNVFRGALREYKHGQRLKIEDMLDFVEIHHHPVFTWNTLDFHVQAVRVTVHFLAFSVVIWQIMRCIKMECPAYTILHINYFLRLQPFYK